MANLSVKGNGSRIPEEQLKYLFYRYFRVDAKKPHTAGLGISLYISFEIIRKHGGDFGADSKQGLGNNFCLSIPTGALSFI